MRLVCFAYKNQNNEFQAPFLDYLEKYAIHERDTEKKKELKVKQIMNIKAHLEYLIENGGKYSLPPSYTTIPWPFHRNPEDQ
ncbi:hypothetical protein HZA43_04415 [Candidatus Peregrinibacteria bacterium]|nr:hypothetical protein [Candidatus Peregrinibacteria bacterium]